MCISPFVKKKKKPTTKPFQVCWIQEQMNDSYDIVRVLYDKNEVLIQGDFNLD